MALFTPSKQLGSVLAQMSGAFTPTKRFGGGTDFAQSDPSFLPPKMVNATAPNEYGVDPALGYNPVGGLNANGVPVKFGSQQMQGYFPMMAAPGVPTPGQPVSTGATPTVGGDWAGVEQWSSQIATAAAKYGVPVNLIKAVMKLESNGDPNAGGAEGVWGPMQVNSSANAWGVGPWSNNADANIDKGVQILAGEYAKYGDWGTALEGYHGFGWDGNTTDTQYRDIVQGNWNTLNGATGTAGIGSPATTGSPIVDIAEKYLGTPYVWGSAPGKGASPTSWDCSGFTYWLDQNYGTGTLPQGSHQQYQQAISQGRLFTDTSQLQAGDLIYFYTEDDPGYTDPASHVAVYVGNGQIIHAANPDAGTIISNLSDPYYQNRFLGAEHMSWSGSSSAPGAAAPVGSAAPGSFAQSLSSFAQQWRQ